MDFHFLVWSPLHADRANFVMILKTSEALARLAPQWRIRLYCSAQPKPTEKIFGSLGINPPGNLSLDEIFPVSHTQLGEILNNRSGAAIQAQRQKLQDHWRKRLAGSRAVIYTRNIKLIQFFHDLNLEGIPLLLELHQLKYGKGFSRQDLTLGQLRQGLKARRDLEFSALRKADLIYCISNPLARRLQMTDPSINTRILRSAASLDAGGSDAPNQKGPVRDIDLLYAGQLYSWKGVHVAIEALRHLPEAVRLTVVGGNDPRTLYMARKAAENWGVGHRIDWVGQVPHYQVADYQRRAKIGLVPLSRQYRIARWYTSPIKIFELIAAGATLLVSDLPSMRDILEPGRTAEFALPDDPVSWAGKISGLLADEPRRRALADEAYRRMQEFTFDERARRIIEGVRALFDGDAPCQARDERRGSWV